MHAGLIASSNVKDTANDVDTRPGPAVLNALVLDLIFC